MKTKWLIEKNLFTDTEPYLIKVLKKKQIEYKLIEYIPFENDLSYISKLFNDDDCVVFYGSLNLGIKIKRYVKWIPGVYLDETKYNCTSYYPIFGDLLVHKNYTMLPFGDLIRRKDYLYNLYNKSGHSGHIFIRPNSGLKDFTGTVLSYNNYEEGIKLCGFYDINPDLLVIVSDVKALHKEWRFVVVNQEVISGSLYRDWSYPETIIPGTTTKDYILMGSHSINELCTNDKAYNFANKCAKLFNPEHVWTLDVTEMNGEFGLLEVGSFSGAGLYGNDLNIIVDKVSKAAEEEWNEYNII